MGCSQNPLNYHELILKYPMEKHDMLCEYHTPKTPPENSKWPYTWKKFEWIGYKPLNYHHFYRGFSLCLLDSFLKLFSSPRQKLFQTVCYIFNQGIFTPKEAIVNRNIRYKTYKMVIVKKILTIHPKYYSLHPLIIVHYILN